MLERIFDRFWPRPIILFVFLAFAFTTTKDFFDESKSYSPIYCWIILLTYLFITLFIIWNMYKCYYISKAKKRELGILILINAETREIHKDTKSKFVESFTETLRRRSIVYKVIVIPFDRSNSVNNYNKIKFIDLLSKKNCIYFIKVNVKCDECKDNNYYEIDISSAVVQKKNDKFFTDIIQKELAYVSSKNSHHKYSSDVKTAFLRLQAAQLTYICQYIIGISLLLDAQFETSSNLLNELKNQLSANEHDSLVVKKIEDHLKWWGYEANINTSQHLIETYSLENNIECLEKAYSSLQLANQYMPDKFGYYLNMAYYLVAKNRNIGKAKEFIDICAKINDNQRWRYGAAFICAYKNEDGAKIYKMYENAFTKSDYSISKIIMFIENIISIDKDVAGLYLALALLYWELDDHTNASEYFRHYKKDTYIDNIDQHLRNCIKKRYQKDIAALF